MKGRDNVAASLAMTEHPSTAAYLASLPDGVASYPECQVKAEVYTPMRGALEEIERSGVPPEVLTFLDVGWSEAWMPEVIAQVCVCLLYDRLGESDFLDWIGADGRRLYNGAVMRHLMRLVSPTLLVMGAASRWSALRRGTQLSTGAMKRDGDRTGGDGFVRFPGTALSRPFLESLCASFRAAIEGAHGRDVEARLVDVADGTARYYMAWTR